MPESRDEIARDSRWPAFFPSPICLVTVHDGKGSAVEKVVGASIVNRFPYVMALSFCREPLSSRHYARRAFTGMLEKSGRVVVQYLLPGPTLDRALEAVASIPDEECRSRIARSGLRTRTAVTNCAPVFESAYLVYEASLARPMQDFAGAPIYREPWIDVGSHRVYFLEVNAIQLRIEIAQGEQQIIWHSLPVWQPLRKTSDGELVGTTPAPVPGYRKGYTPHYVFPSSQTAAFEYDDLVDGMAVKHLPSLPADQVEVDDDRARWPCFFPSSAGMITTQADASTPNLMPCGSTTVLSRHPMVIAPCVSYASINRRYAPRATLDLLRKSGKFGCGVPFISDRVIEAIRYAGNTSLAQDRDKLANSGLHVDGSRRTPVLDELPIHFDCEIVGEVPLGTHVMFLGEVREISVRTDVSKENPLEWCPWASVAPARTLDPNAA
jgi:flavin reductase (DIM6/NTAB) family NADH-FMN oxidoreductase RutF